MASSRTPRHLRRGGGDRGGEEPRIPGPRPQAAGAEVPARHREVDLGGSSIEFLADLCAAAVASPAGLSDPVAQRVAGVLVALLARRAPDQLLDAVLPFWVGTVQLRTYRTGDLEPVAHGADLRLGEAVRRLVAAPAGTFDVAEVVWHPASGGEHLLLRHDGEHISYLFPDQHALDVAEVDGVALPRGVRAAPAPPVDGIADEVAARVVEALRGLGLDRSGPG